VINVEPQTREGEDLLGRRVPRVSVRGVSTIRAALDVFDDAGIPVSYQELGPRQRFGSIDLDLTDVTVREALNAIVKVDGDLVWLFAHSKRADSKGTFILFSVKKSGGTTVSEEWQKTKRWKREHGKNKGGK
jgi:hypothetical protein